MPVEICCYRGEFALTIDDGRIKFYYPLTRGDVKNIHEGIEYFNGDIDVR
jgi:hypothetical protein